MGVKLGNDELYAPADTQRHGVLRRGSVGDRAGEEQRRRLLDVGLHDGADQEEHRRAVLGDRSVSSIGIAALPPASLPPAFPPRSFFPVSFAPRYLRI